MLIGINNHVISNNIKSDLAAGPPGSGKSFLVDLWFSSLPTPYKIRRHYNELVLEVYRGGAIFIPFHIFSKL